jgi:hypothetical protein
MRIKLLVACADSHRNHDISEDVVNRLEHATLSNPR